MEQQKLHGQIQFRMHVLIRAQQEELFQALHVTQPQPLLLHVLVDIRMTEMVNVTRTQHVHQAEHMMAISTCVGFLLINHAQWVLMM